jgi:hypothetical protein
MRKSAVGLAAGLAACAALASENRAVGGGADGILLQRVLVAAYLREAGPTRLGLLQREVQQFEAYLWRHSGRKVRVEAVLARIGRSVDLAEMQGSDPRWGYALGRSERVERDLLGAGYDPASYDGLILLFDPPRGRPCLAAGLTWHGQRTSAVPLKDNLFEEGGHRHPLHFVLVHEYLHQIDSAFEEAGRAAGFEDPDRVGRSGSPACVLPGDEYPFFRTSLQQDAQCRPPEWRALDGHMGTWIAR